MQIYRAKTQRKVYDLTEDVFFVSPSERWVSEKGNQLGEREQLGKVVTHLITPYTSYLLRGY